MFFVSVASKRLRVSVSDLESSAAASPIRKIRQVSQGVSVSDLESSVAASCVSVASKGISEAAGDQGQLDRKRSGIGKDVWIEAGTHTPGVQGGVE